MSPQSKRASGFTLLELLIVMAIMVLLSTIMAVSYFGAQRAASYTACAADVRNALTLARQRACLNGRDTYVAFFHPTEATGNAITDFIVVQPVGKVSVKESDKIYWDGYSDMRDNDDAGNLTVLYNLTTFKPEMASASTVTLTDVKSPHTSKGSKLYEGQVVTRLLFYKANTEIKTASDIKKELGPEDSHGPQNSKWNEGDEYGVAVAATMRLPKGFEASFTGVDSEGDFKYVCFKPDGSAKRASTIVIQETLKGNSSANRVEVKVTASGQISVK